MDIWRSNESKALLATTLVLLAMACEVRACSAPTAHQHHQGSSRHVLQLNDWQPAPAPQQEKQQQQLQPSSPGAIRRKAALAFLASLWHATPWGASQPAIKPSGSIQGIIQQQQFMRCGTPSPSSSERAAADNITSQRLGIMAAARASSPAAAAPIVVSTYFHVITTDDGTQGAVSDEQLAQQMAVLNHAYAVCGVSFLHAGTSRTANTAWFNVRMSSPEEDAMKRTLHQGTASTLNVYLVGSPSGILGWSQFPWLYNDKPKNDGSVIMYTTLPGGSFKPYNMGITVVHEAGHFLGLYHTFEGGCINFPGTGDQVLDTPAQRLPTYGCPTKPISSCPFKLAVDPVHNIMNYADDSCMDLNQGFTKGQCARVQDMWRAWRAGR